MHSILVGFQDDWQVPLKETTKQLEWNEDLTMKLQTEKLENKTRSKKRILEPLGLGRLYTLDIASDGTRSVRHHLKHDVSDILAITERPLRCQRTS